MNRTLLVALTSLWLVCGTRCVNGQLHVRIKDIATIEGERTNQLTGMGLVTGLAGTGGNTPNTRILAANLLQRLGNRIDPQLRNAIRNDTQQKTDSLSVVVVSAELPVGSRPGERIDAVVSTFDDAESLRGGFLVMTPLFGVDGKVYATASGSLASSGYEFGGDGANVTKNHPTVARLPNQVIVERETPMDCAPEALDEIRLLLNTPDWDTAGRIAKAINEQSPGSATPESARSVYVSTPTEKIARSNFIRTITNLRISPDVNARVVINERTGTVTIGQNVKLAAVAIAHGNLSVITAETPQVSQPAPFSEGETTVVPRTEVDVIEESKRFTVINDASTVGDLAAALNALGVSPNDISAIFQQLEAAGALHATLEFQ